MARKTVEVEYIRARANDALSEDSLSDDERKGVANMLMLVLHKTDNYRGFRYRDVDIADDGQVIVLNEWKRYYY